jgi:GNAT superfamily N-acetyltransferase
MEHLDILGTFKEFNYVLYKNTEEKLVNEFNKVYEILKSNGYVIGTRWDLTGGILLESDKSVIGSIFFNTSEYRSVILIQFAFVDPEYRRQGIYRTLHSYVDMFGKNFGKTDIYSYIHLENKDMVDHVSEKIGYKPLMNLVHRPIKK